MDTIGWTRRTTKQLFQLSVLSLLAFLVFLNPKVPRQHQGRKGHKSCTKAMFCDKGCQGHRQGQVFRRDISFHKKARHASEAISSSSRNFELVLKFFHFFLFCPQSQPVTKMCLVIKRSIYGSLRTGAFIMLFTDLVLFGALGALG